MCLSLGILVIAKQGQPTLFEKGLSSFYQLYFDADGKNMIHGCNWMPGMGLVNGL
jgi:hypothetical protein